MRYIFLILLFSFLLFGCGRDAAGVGEETAAAPAIAPASAPATPGDKRNNQTPAKAPDVGAEEIGRDQMAPVEQMHAPPVTREEAKRLSPVNRGKPAQNQSVTPANPTPDQSPSAQFELNGGDPSAVVDVNKIEAEQVFNVSKTPCYGDCKQYAVTVYNNGLVILNGKKNVSRTGYFSLVLEDYPQSKLMDFFRDATADGLLKVYPAGKEAPVDVPATVLRYPGVNGLPQSIRVYGGAPEKLQRLFDLVEEMAEQADWKIAKG